MLRSVFLAADKTLRRPLVIDVVLVICERIWVACLLLSVVDALLNDLGVLFSVAHAGYTCVRLIVV